MNSKERKKKILDYVAAYGEITNSEGQAITGAHRNTITKDFGQLIKEQLLIKSGDGKGAKYSAKASIIFDKNAIDTIFPKDKKRALSQFFKQRKRAKSFFNKTFEAALSANFSYPEEITNSFKGMAKRIRERREILSAAEKKCREEKLIIDLSWASSNIEGNTYSLLETESLIKYNQTTKGKTFHEAKMILNHKSAIEYIRQGSSYKKLSKRNIFELHQILTSELEVNTGFREHLVAISSSSYVPCDNQFQIIQFFDEVTKRINSIKCVLTKAIAANLLIAYLQPFSDGNKRTSRMIGNAILLANNYLPISFVHTPKEEYIKAVLYFYEKQDPSYFKMLFLSELNHSFVGYDLHI